MSRLIDADRLKSVIERNFARPDGFKQLVDAQPTAYDPDKVVEQLEDYLFEKYCVEGDSKIEEIVKGRWSE